MMLPPSCKVNKVSPENLFSSGGRNTWTPTDVAYSLVLSQQSHVIVLYQFAGDGSGRHFVTRISINSIPLKHTVSHSSDTSFFGNFGMWQGPLSAGTHKVVFEYRLPKARKHHPEVTDWQTRTMSVISC